MDKQAADIASEAIHKLFKIQSLCSALRSYAEREIEPKHEHAGHVVGNIAETVEKMLEGVIEELGSRREPSLP